MLVDKNCDHDFLGVLHCKKCGEQYHTNWVDALGQAKLEAIEEILRRIQSTIKLKSRNTEAKKEAYEIVKKAFEEVKKVYIESKRDNEKNFIVNWIIKDKNGNLT